MWDSRSSRADGGLEGKPGHKTATVKNPMLLEGTCSGGRRRTLRKSDRTPVSARTMHDTLQGVIPVQDKMVISRGSTTAEP